MFGLSKLFKSKQPPTESYDPSLILPRIKHLNFERFLREQDFSQDDMPIMEPLFGDLLLTYAFDLPKRFEMVSNKMAADLSLSPDQIRGIAMKNFEERFPEIGLMGEIPFFIVCAGNDMEATMLLRGEFWDNVAKEMPGELVVSVIAPDKVLVFSSEEKKLIAHAKDEITSTQHETPTRALSELLYVRRDGDWHVFDWPD
jgi:uncharacterized protein YtpQ (UPF0354 family)